MLVDWHTKVFKMPWSMYKLRIIQKSLLRIITDNSVTLVVVRIPPEQKQGSYLKQLARAILQTLKEYPVSFCLRDVRGDNSTPTSKGLHALILTHYPELLQECKRELQNKTSYYYKIFEAVESVHCILKKQ